MAGSAAGPGWVGRRVLVVGDDPDFLFLARRRLEQEGCVVATTMFPELALAWAIEDRPGLVVVDFALAQVLASR